MWKNGSGEGDGRGGGKKVRGASEGGGVRRSEFHGPQRWSGLFDNVWVGLGPWLQALIVEKAWGNTRGQIQMIFSFGAARNTMNLAEPNRDKENQVRALARTQILVYIYIYIKSLSEAWCGCATA